MISIKGKTIFPGNVTAKAFVIKTQNFDSTLVPKEDFILVCKTTTPHMLPVLLKAKGLIAESGGLLSHAAIVAREAGIPAVIGVRNATQEIKTGQTIEINEKGDVKTT